MTFEAVPQTGRVRPRSSNWVTSTDAEYINSLCPVSKPSFPEFSSDCEEQSLIEKSFSKSFKGLNDHWRTEWIPAIRDLTQTELLVLSAIEQKTLRFGKLVEKIPRRILREGHVEADGELATLEFDVPILRPLEIDDRALTKGIRGLIEKGRISKVPADPHPIYGRSNLFSPMPISEAINLLVGNARRAARAEVHDAAYVNKIFNPVAAEISARTVIITGRARIGAAAAGRVSTRLPR